MISFAALAAVALVIVIGVVFVALALFSQRRD